MPKDVETIADLLIEAHRQGRQIAVPPPGIEPPTREKAFAIQDRVREALGGVGGWKTGAPGPEMLPIAAPLLASLIGPSPADLPASRFHAIGVEAELAFRFARALPRRDEPYSQNEVTDAVASLHVSIEVVDSRLGAWAQDDDMWKLADNQINGYFVHGPAVIDWRGRDLEHAPVELLIDGKVAVAHDNGGNPAGDPMSVVTWLANHLAETREGLQADAIVTSGSCTGLIWVEPGAEIVARFPGIGEAAARFPLLSR
jgi:2-keto-4-pentenoate hydratase